MKPLHELTYIKRKKRKSFSVIACIAAAVFLLYTFQILMSSLTKSSELINLKPLEKYSFMSPSRGAISSFIVSTIKSNENVARVIPATAKYTIYSAGTMTSGVYIYEMNTDDIKYYMNALGINLKEGRLPEHSKDEIILDYRLAKNKNLKLGDVFGSEVNRNECLEGKYKIVGITTGPSITALTLSDKTIYKEEPCSSGMLVFPKQNKLKAVNDLLRSESYGTYLLSYDNMKEILDKDSSTTYMTTNIIAAMIIAALSICVGNICYVHFFQRRREFGILNALGYSHNFIIKRAFYEISSMNFIGFTLGLIASIIVGIIIKIIFLFSFGIPTSLISKSGFIQCLCIPVFTTIFALKPISFMIKRIDAVTMIEGVK